MVAEADAKEIVAEPAPRTLPTWARSTLWFIVISAALIAAWEGYKLVYEATDGTIPILGADWPVRGDNRTMPHVWDIWGALFAPVRRGGDETLLQLLVEAMIFTLREAALGFAIGGIIGFSIGVLFVRSSLAERAFMPYVVASQTVPILAIAPMVVLWVRRYDIPSWVGVSIIAAYLTFFPVAINTLRGLRSPQATATELMRSYAARKNEVLWKLQVPAATPYIFTALKVAATASVIGAIIGELPTGSRDGLGRALLEFSQQFAAAPEKLYGAVLVAALAGIIFVGVVGAMERLLVPPSRRVAQ